jgi:hypothetical protein
MKLITEIENIRDPTKIKKFEHQSGNLTLLMAKLEASVFKNFILKKKSKWRIKKISSDSPVVFTLVQIALADKAQNVHLELLDDEEKPSLS